MYSSLLFLQVSGIEGNHQSSTDGNAIRVKVTGTQKCDFNIKEKFLVISARCIGLEQMFSNNVKEFVSYVFIAISICSMPHILFNVYCDMMVTR